MMFQVSYKTKKGSIQKITFPAQNTAEAIKVANRIVNGLWFTLVIAGVQ